MRQPLPVPRVLHIGGVYVSLSPLYYSCIFYRYIYRVNGYALWRFLLPGGAYHDLREWRVCDNGEIHGGNDQEGPTGDSNPELCFYSVKLPRGMSYLASVSCRLISVTYVLEMVLCSTWCVYLTNRCRVRARIHVLVLVYACFRRLSSLGRWCCMMGYTLRTRAMAPTRI